MGPPPPAWPAQQLGRSSGRTGRVIKSCGSGNVILLAGAAALLGGAAGTIVQDARSAPW